MAKQEPTEPKLEARPRGQWECGINGRCGADDPENENSPEIRITTTAWVASDTGETLGYTCEAFRRDWHTSPIEWASIAEPGQRERNQIDAWNGARVAVIKYLREQYREYLEASEVMTPSLEDARRLLLVVRGELGREGARIREKARPEFEAVEGDDLLFCLKLADQHFAALETAANVYFRLRLSPDGEPWASGKDRHNNKIVIPGKSEKCSPEKADLLQPVLGWTPDFIVTICNETWKDAKPEQRGGIVHHLLTQCGIADEKFFIAKPEFTAFGSTVKALGPEAVPGATIFVHDAIEGARRMDQLDLFREMSIAMEAMETPEQIQERAEMKLGARKLSPLPSKAIEKSIERMRNSLAPGQSVTISSGGKSATLTSNKKPDRYEDEHAAVQSLTAKNLIKHGDADAKAVGEEYLKRNADKIKRGAASLVGEPVPEYGEGNPIADMQTTMRRMEETAGPNVIQITDEGAAAIAAYEAQEKEESAYIEEMGKSEDPHFEPAPTGMTSDDPVLADDDFEADDAEESPEPLPPVEDVSTDPTDDLIMDAVKLACTARVGSPGIIAKARENGANDTDLKHIICLAFGMGSASRTMGDHLVLFVGKNNDPMISISETKTKAVVRTIAGAELLALVRLGFGIDAPQGAKRGAAMKAAGVTV